MAVYNDGSARLLRVFICRTSQTPIDDMAFIGEPPLIRPDANEVHVSTVFTWDKQEAHRLADAWRQYYPVVKVSGPAFDDPGNGFTPGLYTRLGITITSRGCPHECPWCLVPKREGKLRELPVMPGWIIQDNNLLRCSRGHIERVFAMCRQQKQAIRFLGGLEAAALTNDIAEQLRSLRIAEVWLSADHDGVLPGLQRTIHKLRWLPRGKKRCYVLLGFNGETIPQAEARLEAVWQAGCLPFAQLYRDEADSVQWSKEWRGLARTWSRPAAMIAMHKENDASRL